jgi:hypothetical protein
VNNGNLKRPRSTNAAIRTTSSWRARMPTWNPPSGLSWGNQPNQEKNARSSARTTARPTNPKRPADPVTATEQREREHFRECPEEHRPAGERTLPVVVRDHPEHATAAIKAVSAPPAPGTTRSSSRCERRSRAEHEPVSGRSLDRAAALS